MVPGKYTCPENWTREYYGYLMAERNNHHRSTFECMDRAPETVVGGHANQDGARFYHVLAKMQALWASGSEAFYSVGRLEQGSYLFEVVMQSITQTQSCERSELQTV